MRHGTSDQWSVVSGQQDHKTGRAHLLATGHRPLAAAFTVTELLIVIGIIILAMALALPALNLITGNKSTEAATNQISALLARARDDAIGLQQTRGVMFYYDAAEDRVNAALVEETDRPDPAQADTPLAVDIYLDLTDADQLKLPKGVSLQTVDNCQLNTATTPPQRTDDGYIGFNAKNNTPNASSNQPSTQYGGVILFDSHGLLVSKSYAFLVHKNDQTQSGVPPPQIFTAMGALLYSNQPVVYKGASCNPSNYTNVVPVNPGLASAPKGSQYVIRSQVGFVLFDLESFRNQGFNFSDDQITTDPSNSYSAGEKSEEIWLDGNAIPYLVNRYNGTLVKGE